MPIVWETKALRVVAPEGQKLLSRNPTHQQTMLTQYGSFPSKAEVTVYQRLQTRLWVLESEYPAANVLKELIMLK